MRSGEEIRSESIGWLPGGVSKKQSEHHESPWMRGHLENQAACECGTTKVKQERAQGGCLGTESRRKT